MIWDTSKAARTALSLVLCSSLAAAPIALCGCKSEKQKAEEEAQEQAMSDFEEAQDNLEKMQEVDGNANQQEVEAEHETLSNNG